MLDPVITCRYVTADPLSYSLNSVGLQEHNYTDVSMAKVLLLLGFHEPRE